MRYIAGLIADSENFREQNSLILMSILQLNSLLRLFRLDDDWKLIVTHLVKKEPHLAA